MELYLAPMESITGHVYRNAYAKWYGEIERYITPFISPNQNRCMNSREALDVSVAMNQNLDVVPQILTNKADQFLRTCEELAELGYKEVNLNLGCPSGTVVSKGKGAGFLEDIRALDAFLKEIFQKCPLDISIKTRTGMEYESEWEDLIKLYNQYPLKELIVHPRLRRELYNGTPNLELFAQAVEQYQGTLVYNGDLYTVEDYARIQKLFPTVEKFMCGRGVLRNPALPHLLQGKKNPGKDVLRSFHDQLVADYGAELSGDRNLLFKMKEMWFYLSHSFEGCEKPLKKIRKAERLAAYEDAVDAVFACTYIG